MFSLRILAIALISVTSAAAQKSADLAAIKKLCGCFEVSFQYAETFSPRKEYTFDERYKTSAREWVFVDEESKNKLVLMHLLIINDSTVIKHWREDWIYQNTDLLAYNTGWHWTKHSLPKDQVKGQWTQKVFEVNDMPRYEGSAAWIHSEGKHFWDNIADAPLPRREYTKRSDYQVLRRHNRLYVSNAGYLHEQDNDKIIRNQSADELLAQEKGINDYRKIRENDCAIAKVWWEKNGTIWRDVRAAWSELIEQNQGIHLTQKSVNGKRFEKAINGLVSELATTLDKTDAATRRASIKKLIEEYIITEKELYSQN